MGKDTGLACRILKYVGCTMRKFTLYGLAPDQTHYFVVTAYDTSGNESGYSVEVNETIVTDAIQPGDVTNFVATAFGSGVRLSWTNPPDTDLASLLLSFSFNGGAYVSLAGLTALPGQNQTYDHQDLVSGAYDYKIRTLDTSGNITNTAYTGITLGTECWGKCGDNSPQEDPMEQEDDDTATSATPSGGGCGHIKPPPNQRIVDISFFLLLLTSLLIRKAQQLKTALRY